MNIKNKKAMIILIFTVIYCICAIASVVYAIDIQQADDFISHGKDNAGISDLTDIGKNFTDIGAVLMFIGAGILVAGLGYIGIMYMISPPEKRGKLKQQLIGLLVAGVVIFGAYSIWSVLVQVLSSVIDPAK